MPIELPKDLIERIRQRMAPGQTEADVIRAALDAFDHLEQECAAIQVGIAAMQAGEMVDWKEFDRQFRGDNGLEPKAR